jgi:hypothetical protein
VWRGSERHQRGRRNRTLLRENRQGQTVPFGTSGRPRLDQDSERAMINTSKVVSNQHETRTSLVDRRGFLIGAGAVGMALGGAISRAYVRSGSHHCGSNSPRAG